MPPYPLSLHLAEQMTSDRSGILEELFLALPPGPKLQPADAGALRSLATLMGRSGDDPALRHRVFMLLQVRVPRLLTSAGTDMTACAN